MSHFILFTWFKKNSILVSVIYYYFYARFPSQLHHKILFYLSIIMSLLFFIEEYTEQSQTLEPVFK